MSKIIVTGGAGYIGSHTVVELIESGFEPIIIDNFVNSERGVKNRIEKIAGRKVSLYDGDCTDESFINSVFEKEGPIDGVIHFAAYKAVGESVKFPLKYYQNNLQSLQVILNAMQQFNVIQIVFSSSCTVYGQPASLPVKESSTIKLAESPYGKTKQISEQILTDTVKSITIKKNGSLKALSLRYFNPVGAHSSSLIGELPIGVPNNLVPFITQTAAGWRNELTIFGDNYATPDGTNIRDYIHVVDLAKAHVKSIEFLKKRSELTYYDVFNLGTGKGNSVLEVVKVFEKVSGKKLNYRIGAPREGDIEQVYGNVDKAKEQLGWHNTLSLEDSLLDAWNWQQTLDPSTRNK